MMTLLIEIFIATYEYFKCLLNEIFLVWFEVMKITFVADNMNNTERIVNKKKLREKLMLISCNPKINSVNILACFI